MTLFGWCQGNNYHALCRVEFTSQFGVTHTCTCDCHGTED